MMDLLFKRLAEKMGGQVQIDHLKLVACLIATYPSAFLFRSLPRPFMKHWFSILFSSYILCVVLNSWKGFIHITATCLFTWFFMKHYHGRSGPWINFAVIMVSMSICHLDRQFNDIKGDAVLDYSGSLMVVVMKLSGFGFNVLDGRRQTPLSEFHQRVAIKGAYPSLTSFFGWMFFFAGLLIGPAFDYMDYIRLVTLPLNETSPVPLTEKQRGIALPIGRRLCMLFVQITIMILSLVYIYPTFNYNFLLSKYYAELPLTYRFLFIQLTGVMTRVKFYTVWLLAESACTIVGISFNGFDENDQPRWDRVVNANLNFEWSSSVKICSVRWNSGASRWLNHYVYSRVKTSGSHTNALFLTYTISSVWHGFHTGYIVFFLSIAGLQYVGGLMRRMIRPLLMTPDMMHESTPLKKVYDIAGIFLSITSVNLCCASFFLLDAPKYMSVFRSVHYYQLVVALVGGVIWLTAKSTLIPLQKRRIAQYHQQLETKRQKVA